MSYALTADRPPDFRVRYRWVATSESVVKQQPFQHMRCDFAYAGDDLSKEPVYMILPEFEDDAKQPLSTHAVVPRSGFASMWIRSDDLRQSVHRTRINVGVRGFFVVGPHPIAEVEVTEVLGLHT